MSGNEMFGVLDFGRWAVGYYGPWPIGQHADVKEYLSGSNDRYLLALKEELRLNHEARFGPPCIATLRKYHDAAVNRMRLESPPPIAIPDETGYLPPEETARIFDAMREAISRRVFK